MTITHSVHENRLLNSEGTYRAVVESIRTIAFEGVLDRMMLFQ